MPPRRRVSRTRVLGSRRPPSHSSVRSIHREITICYAYLCGYAYACAEKSARPAQVMRSRCMRYLPDALRVPPAVSDFALDILACHREKGESLSAATGTILDEMRPNGPLRRLR